MGPRENAAAIRNLATTGSIDSRDGDTVQGSTRFGRTVKGKELFPYGFAARGTTGTILYLFEGGDVRSPIIMPVSSQDGVPDLKDGDSAFWTKNGGWVINRNSGCVELYGTSYGGLIKVNELISQLAKITVRIDGIINAVSNAAVASGDGGATFKTNLIAALQLLADKEDFSSIASEKVFHGDGSD